MPKTINVEGVGPVNFPDEATQDEILEFLNREYPGEQVSGLRAFGQRAALGVAPGLAFTQAFPVGAAWGAGLGPIGAGVGGIAAGTLAALGTGFLQKQAIRAAAPEFSQKLERQLAAGEAQHPIISAAGDIASLAPSARIAPFVAKQIPFRLGLGAAVGAALPVVTEGRKPTAQDIAVTAAMGTIYGEPRINLGGRLAAIARAKTMLPRAAAQAEREVADAVSERVVQKDRIQEREQIGPRGLPAEAGGGHRAVGGAAVEPQVQAGVQPAEVSEAGRQRVLVGNRPAVKTMPDEAGKFTYVEAERLPTGEWETHDQIIERAGLTTDQIDRRVFLDQQGREKPREQTAQELQLVGEPTKVPGEAHSTDVNRLVAKTRTGIVRIESNQPLPQGLLDAYGQQVLEAERSGIKHPIEVVPESQAISEEVKAGLDPANVRQQLVVELNRSPDVTEINARREQLARRAGFASLQDYQQALTTTGDPFAILRTRGAFLKASPKTGTILMFPEEFRAWLRSMDPKDWPQAIRSALSEESLHLKTPADKAVPYWNALSALEKYSEQRIYLGPDWKTRGPALGITDSHLGLEAIRRRLQRLNRMTSTEAASTSGRERWTVKSLEVLSDVVRGIREGLGTDASQLQLDIINRIQGNLDAAKNAAAAVPAALRREAERQTREMFLPEVKPGEVVEREGFVQPTPRAVTALAEQHWSDLSKPPSLDQFTGELQSRFGATVTKDSAYYAWQDAMMKRLLTAKGTEIESLMDQLGLRRRVAEALKPGEAEPMLGRGRIPDAIEMPTVQRELGEINRFFKKRQWRTAAAFRQKFGPELRRRYAAIGEIIDKLSEQAGPAPKKPTLRTEVGPEDISQSLTVTEPGRAFTDPETGLTSVEGAQFQSKPGWRTLTVEERKAPQSVGKLATEGARVEGEKFTVTKNLLTLKDKAGRIILVSAWRDTRAGPKVTNPENPTAPARLIDAKLLSQYEPMVVQNLRQPVEKGFRQVFDNQEEFDRHFGDIGIEGPEGISTSMFAGPEAGAARAQAGFAGVGAPSPAKVVTPLVTRTAGEGARELTLPRFARRFVPAGAIPEAAPQPTPSRLLPPEALPHVQAIAEREAAAIPSEFEQKVTGRGVPKFTMPARRLLGPRMFEAPESPAALRRNLQAEAELVRRDLLTMVKALPTRDRIARTADAVGNTNHIQANQWENWVRFASVTRPAGRLARMLRPWERGNPDVLGAANVLLESTYDPTRAMWQNIALRRPPATGSFYQGAIPIFRREIERGRVRAEARMRDPDPRIAKIGRAEMRAYEQYKRELDYADQHWNDPELQETARRLRYGYNERLAQMQARNINVHQEPGFDPHRYDAAVWNGHSFLFNWAKGLKRILGERTLAQRTFDSYYHAFGADAFLPVTRDSASLINHYLRKTGNLMYREEWRELLKTMKTHDGMEVAADPKQKGNAIVPHKLGYEIVHDGYHALSVHGDYANLVSQLVSPSHIEMSDLGRPLLHFSQVLKHSILLGDFFHLGRMFYYGASIMGTKAGFKSGWSVLDIAPGDMAEAKRLGIISQRDIDWANHMIDLPRGRTITRRELATKFYEEMGANLGRVQDALYKDLVTQLSPAAGELRRAFVFLADPTIGRYNRFLFDKLTRGLMAESNVREFERQMKLNPNVSPKRLMADISRDVNNFFGNIGRQGWFKSKTWQDMMRLTWLAPQWVEGLIKKEAISAGRLTGITPALGLRTGPQQGYLRQLGTTGTAIAQGMMFMLAVTQAINLIFRGKPTWMNEEKEHKFDAYLNFGGEDKGFWLSPLAVFNEISHDLYRLWNSKPTLADAIAQIAGNKEQPVTRAALVGLTGMTPWGSKITTTGGRLKEMGRAVLPVPISFGKVGQYAAHELAPEYMPPAIPGAVERQLAATFGVKIEPAGTAVQATAKLARDFMEREELQKETGWQQIQTDQPGYTKLRAAIRVKDWASARTQLEALRKTRSDQQIIRAMHQWTRRGFTGSQKTERQFLDSLTDSQMEAYNKALEQKLALYNDFANWIYDQP